MWSLENVLHNDFVYLLWRVLLLILSEFFDLLLVLDLLLLLVHRLEGWVQFALHALTLCLVSHCRCLLILWLFQGNQFVTLLLVLAFPDSIDIFWKNSIKFEFNWLAEVDFRLIYHVLLSHFELLEWVLAEQLDVHLEENRHGIVLILLCGYWSLLNELVEALCRGECSDEIDVVILVPDRLFLLPRKVLLEVEEVLTRLESCVVFLFLFRLRGLEEHDVVVDSYEKEVEEELLNGKLGICPILLFKVLFNLTFRHRFVFSSECLEVPILLVHHIFETSEKVGAVRSWQIWQVKLWDELSLLSF